MTIASVGLAFIAGMLSTLSPCVLPLIPIVLGTAATEHRFGPVALASGLALSFTAIGLFIATVGFSLGIDSSVFRLLAAMLLLALGTVLAVPMLQQQFATATGPISTWASDHLSGVTGCGLGGQFTVGLLLGAIWSPCAGPTLGAASVLAAQGKDLGHVALTMLMFGVGAALPLLILGMLSREAMIAIRGRLMNAGAALKMSFGIVLIIAGLLVLSGYDKKLEASLTSASPGWLTDLTVRF